VIIDARNCSGVKSSNVFKLSLQACMSDVICNGRCNLRTDKTRNSNENSGKPRAERSHELIIAFEQSKTALIAVGIFSALINILMLTSAFYMLEVYDRVIPSRSIPTLIVLSGLALILLVAQGGLEVIRSRILIRIGNYFDEVSSERVFDVMTRSQPDIAHHGAALQPMRDIDSIKAFLSTGGPGALFDLPWLPIYVAVMFLFHWLLGVVAIMGAIVLISLTVVAELRTRWFAEQMTRDIAERTSMALASRRNAEVISAMGMGSRLAKRYRSIGISASASQTKMSDVAGGLGSMSRIFRMALQSAILGLGALLVIWDQSSAGIMITGAILMGRALAPIDLVIANWRGLVAARQGWTRLSNLFQKFSSVEARMSLPSPTHGINVERLTVLEPGGQRFLIRDVSFSLTAGQSLCVIGPSGAGKSTLARTLVNAWCPSAGRVELDGVPLHQWQPEFLGSRIGYLPQDVELFSGTIAENISRHLEEPESERVIEAAMVAGVHTMITRFKDGYQTQIGDAGSILSAGQRQRIALARAMYANPFLVVLDEPNSNLDAEGDAALQMAIAAIKERKGIVIAVSHRPSILEMFDMILIMSEGQIAAFGPRDETLSKHVKNGAAIASTTRRPGTVVPMMRPQGDLADGPS
jgi:ATP-binding cassette subfamily C protein PrsD